MQSISHRTQQHDSWNDIGLYNNYVVHHYIVDLVDPKRKHLKVVLYLDRTSITCYEIIGSGSDFAIHCQIKNVAYSNEKICMSNSIWFTSTKTAEGKENCSA